MRKRSGNAELLRIFDEDLVKKAVTRTKEILEDPQAKRTEILNAADKIIKFRFAFQDAVRKQAMDQIDIESKQLKLEEQKIKMELLRGASDPNASTSDKAKAYSAVFDPDDKPEGYYDPDPDEED